MRLEEGDLLFIPFTLGTLPLKSKFEDALKIIAGTLSKFTSMFIGKEPILEQSQRRLAKEKQKG